MVQQWQSMFFDDRLSHVHLTHQVPDYAMLAEAYGAAGFTVSSEDELEPILAAFIRPALALTLDRHGSAFVRVLARAYAEKNDRLRKFLSDNYGQVLREFAKAIAPCLPDLGKEELYWRMDFVAGALTYAMADFGLIKRPAGVSEKTHCDKAAQNLIRFAAAGLRAA